MEEKDYIKHGIFAFRPETHKITSDEFSAWQDERITQIFTQRLMDSLSEFFNVVRILDAKDIEAFNLARGKFIATLRILQSITGKDVVLKLTEREDK